MKRKIIVLILVAWPSVSAAQVSLNTNQIAELNASFTANWYWGVPRQALASFPVCSGNNTGGMRYDTGGNLVYFCNGSAWTAVGGASTSGNNTFTGTNIFQDQAKFQIQNQADATKVFELNLSAMTTATTAVWALGPVGQMRSPVAGTAAAPAFSFTGATGDGLADSAGVGVALSGNGTYIAAFPQTGGTNFGVQIASNGQFGWSSAGAFAAGSDTIFSRDHAGAIRFQTTAAAPTATSCGTGSPTVAGNDRIGIITTGTTPGTTCTLTFTGTYGAAPVCTAQDYSTQVTFIGVPGTASWVLTSSASMGTGDKIGYRCERAN